jgi:hypothetical protein
MDHGRACGLIVPDGRSRCYRVGYQVIKTAAVGLCRDCTAATGAFLVVFGEIAAAPFTKHRYITPLLFHGIAADAAGSSIQTVFAVTDRAEPMPGGAGIGIDGKLTVEILRRCAVRGTAAAPGIRSGYCGLWGRGPVNRGGLGHRRGT